MPGRVHRRPHLLRIARLPFPAYCRPGLCQAPAAKSKYALDHRHKHDALAKVAILSRVLFGADVDVSSIPAKGISHITLEDIRAAKDDGKRYKLVGQTSIESGRITASVSPVKLPMNDPLAGVSGADNALTFDTDHLGAVTIQGPGAGREETGYSILTDILAIHMETRKGKGLSFSREVC